MLWVPVVGVLHVWTRCGEVAVACGQGVERQRESCRWLVSVGDRADARGCLSAESSHHLVDDRVDVAIGHGTPCLRRLNEFLIGQALLEV